jgi:hypothetical protein
MKSQLKARRPYMHAQTRTLPQYPVNKRGRMSSAMTGKTLGRRR